MRTIFWRVNLIVFVGLGSLPWRRLAAWSGSEPRAPAGFSAKSIFGRGDLALHLFEHLLIRDAGAAHFILILDEDVADLLVDAIFNREFLHDAETHAGDDRLDVLFLDFDKFVGDKLLDDFGGQVADIIAVQEHLRGVPRVFYETLSVLVTQENRKKTRWEKGGRGIRLTV